MTALPSPIGVWLCGAWSIQHRTVDQSPSVGHKGAMCHSKETHGAAAHVTCSCSRGKETWTRCVICKQCCVYHTNISCYRGTSYCSEAGWFLDKYLKFYFSWIEFVYFCQPWRQSMSTFIYYKTTLICVVSCCDCSSCSTDRKYICLSLTVCWGTKPAGQKLFQKFTWRHRKMQMQLFSSFRQYPLIAAQQGNTKSECYLWDISSHIWLTQDAEASY